MKTTDTECKTMRILNKTEVIKRTSLCSTSLYYMVVAGKFPQSIKLGNTSRVGWVESEVDQWIADQIAASRIAKAA